MSQTPERSLSNRRSRRRVLQWLSLAGGGVILVPLVGRQRVNGVPPSEPASSPEPTPSPSAPRSSAPRPSAPELTTERLKTVKVNDQGTVIEEDVVEVQGYDETLANGITLRMVEIPGGTFWMGQTEAEKEELIRQVGEETYQGWYTNELPRHQVTIASSFFMGMFEVTQEQYEAVMGENPVTWYGERWYGDHFVAPNKPVLEVTWWDAVAFCDRLSERTGRTYRLPSEAEWEYACRAGTDTPFHFGATLSTEIANYNGTSIYGDGAIGIYRGNSTEVGSFPPNAFGLFDMHGNAFEWCLDHWHGNYQGAPTDGSAWTVDGNSDSRRMVRGGCWVIPPRNCRSAFRLNLGPVNRNSSYGFRVVCEVPRT